MTDKELNNKLIKHYHYLNDKKIIIEFTTAYICINRSKAPTNANDMLRIKQICKFIRNHMNANDTRIIMDDSCRFYVTPQEYKKMPKDAKKCTTILI